MNIRSILIRTLIVAGLGATGYAGFVLWQTWPKIASLAGWTRAPHGQTTQFVVVGDNHGATPIYAQILREAGAAQAAFVLNLADTTEHGSAAEFQAVKQMEASQPLPVIHVLGAHDLKTDPSASAFVGAFGRPPCSAYTAGAVRILLLNNADRKIGFPSACLDWLTAQLQTETSATTIVAYHRPFDLPLGDILGDDETAVSRASNDRFRAILHNEGHVAYVMTAHLHTYLPYTIAGIPAVVSGGGGDPAQTVLGGPKNNFFHYLLVTVKNGVVDVAVHRVQLRD